MKLSDADGRIIFEVSDSIGEGFEAAGAEFGRDNTNIQLIKLLALISTPSIYGTVSTLEADDLLRGLWDTGTLPKEEKLRACWAVWVSTVSSKILYEEPESVQTKMLRIIALVFSQSYEMLSSEVRAYHDASIPKQAGGIDAYSSIIFRIRLAKSLGHPDAWVPEEFPSVANVQNMHPELTPFMNLENQLVLQGFLHTALAEIRDSMTNSKQESATLICPNCGFNNQPGAKFCSGHCGGSSLISLESEAGSGRAGGSSGSGCLLPFVVMCTMLLVSILGVAIFFVSL